MNILFVCTGNTCRSPMAEAILKNMNIEGFSVMSAGVFAANGSHASYQAGDVLLENKIEHKHSSKLLTENEVEWADYIFTMTSSHKALIAERYPASIEKTFTLKEFVHGQDVDLDVVDPYGGDVSIYRETFKELEILIEKLVEKLK